MADKDNTNIHIFYALRNGTFPQYPTTSIDCFSLPYSISTGDLNQDDKLDIAVAYHDDNTIGIFFGQRNGIFYPERLYSTGASRPLSVFIYDLDQDTLLDIITTNDGTNDVSIFLGYGNETFSDAVRISTGFDSHPHDVTVADLNGDSRMDMVVANSGIHCIGVFIASGTATFSKQTIYSTGRYPISVAVGDFNNDSHLDIVTSNYESDDISIFYGNGNGTFRDKVTYSTGMGSKPSSVVVRDFNNDNRLDIISGNSGNKNIGLFIGTNDGTFKNQRFYATGTSAPQLLVAEDINNDNWIDIVVSTDHYYNIDVFLGGPDKNLTGVTTFSTGAVSFPWFVVVNDFNNDRMLDIAVANKKSHNVGILLGHPDGGFETMVMYPTGRNSQPWSLVIADFNHDKKLDIVVMNCASSNIRVLLGNGDGTFSNQNVFSTGSNTGPSFAVAHDFNNDTHLDVVVSNYKVNYLSVFFGDGNGRFSMKLLYLSGTGWYSIGAADFNKDNHIDLVVSNYRTDHVALVFGNGNVSFSQNTIYLSGWKSSSTALTVADFNGDNQLDFVLALQKHASLSIFLGKGNGEFTRGQTYPTGYVSRCIVVGDLNNDTQKDLIVANYAVHNVGVLLGNGDGTFSAVTTYSTGFKSYPNSVAIGDFNGDDHIDVVVALSYYYSIVIFLGYYNSPFTSPLIYTSSSLSLPYALATADFNNDSIADIAFVDQNNGDVGVYLSSSKGRFQQPMLYSTGNSLGFSSIAITDMNNDNRYDIIVSGSYDDRIYILLGTENEGFPRSIPYMTGFRSKPVFVSVGDVDGNSHTDIVTANAGDDSINIFLHYGFGSFMNIVKYSNNANRATHAIAIGDFNEDKRLDLVAANYGASSTQADKKVEKTRLNSIKMLSVFRLQSRSPIGTKNR